MGKKAAVLLLVFIAAAAVCFLWPAGREEDAGTAVYTAMEAASLPVVYPQMQGQEMAPLFGQVQTGSASAVSGRGSLLVLPEDRRLTVRIADSWEITTLRYEIRSLDGEHLVERTELSGWQNGEDGAAVTLPIQNLLEEDTQYSLGLCAGLSDGRQVWYYTRIVETDGSHVSEMLKLAESFSEKTLDYSQAQELTMYMESSPDADNSTFGTVTLKNSFTQITWGDLAVEREGEVYVRLRELSGELANIELSYVARRTEDEKTERFAVTENFTMKWAAQRIYMMDYERRMDQLFTGERALFSGKRILLGINSGRSLSAKTGADGKLAAFAANGELWAYDARKQGGTEGLFSREDGRSILIFSFGAGYEDDVRASNSDHGIEILRVGDDGGIDFLVYGYMNRGSHEGTNGIAGYSYDADKNVLEERFFLESGEDSGQLKLDVETLAHLGENGVLYLYLAGTVYGIDLSSREYVAVVSGLTDDTFAVSADGSRLAWQENADAYDAGTVSIMDLDTGDTRQVSGEKGEVCRLIGFVGSDCVYGVGDRGDYILSNGRIMGIFLKELTIVDRQMEVVKTYAKEDSWIRSARVEDSRIHIENVRDRSGGFFADTQTDTLVCNEEEFSGRLDEIGWYASEDKGRIYFVQLENSIGTDDTIRAVSPDTLAIGEAETLVPESGQAAQAAGYSAYGRGRFLGRFVHFADAAAAAYDCMGFVCAGEDTVIWQRGGKPNSAHIRDYEAAVRRLEKNRAGFADGGQTEDGSLMVDLSGCTLSQVLYFVGNGMPVAVYTGEGACQYLVGYDQAGVRLYHPEDGTVESRTMEEAESDFGEKWNDFICCVFS